MQPGDTITLRVRIQTVAGVASTGRVVGDVLLTVNGAAATISGWTEGITRGVWRYYSGTFTAPAAAGPFSWDVQAASPALYVAEGSIGEIEANDLDSIATALTATVGAATGGTGTGASESTAPTIVAGDSWTSDAITGTALAVPAAVLAPFGLADLTGCTVSSALKAQPSDSPITAGITTIIVSAAARTVRVSWTTYPAGMALAAGETSKTFYLDIQIKHTATGRIITVLRYALPVVWERDTTT